MEKNVEPEQRAFSPMARWILAIFSLLFGLIMLLWASGSDNDFRYLPSAFCFAIFGASVLPKPIAVWCGRFIAVVVLIGCTWFIYLGVTDPNKDLINSLRVFGIYGVPALFFLLYSKLPFSFTRRPNPALNPDAQKRRAG
jgi:hypothetical protein